MLCARLPWYGLVLVVVGEMVTNRGCGCASDRPAPVATPSPAPPVITAPPSLNAVLVYKDEAGTLFVRESNGLRVTAIDTNGKVLWHKNLGEEKAVQGEGGMLPVIVALSSVRPRTFALLKDQGQPGEYVEFKLSTGAYGVINKKTAAVTQLGPDER